MKDPTSSPCNGTPLLLTAADASRALSISERTLARLTAAGQLPVVRIGRSIRYSTKTLADFISQRESVFSTMEKTTE
jgi:excisionase family DNA binding protein